MSWGSDDASLCRTGSKVFAFCTEWWVGDPWGIPGPGGTHCFTFMKVASGHSVGKRGQKQSSWEMVQLSRREVASSGPQNGLGSREKGGHSGSALEVEWPGRSSGSGVEDGQRDREEGAAGS